MGGLDRSEEPSRAGAVARVERSEISSTAGAVARVEMSEMSSRAGAVAIAEMDEEAAELSSEMWANCPNWRMDLRDGRLERASVMRAVSRDILDVLIFDFI